MSPPYLDENNLGESKSKEAFKTDGLSHRNDTTLEEYFETDVKYKVESDLELEMSKHDFLGVNDKAGKKEYFESDVKSEVESDSELV